MKNELKEKSIFLFIILFLIISGIIFIKDFQGQIWGAYIWFGLLGIALSRLIYFFIKKK
jgi:uncharacterized MnhB-related membrane protein